MNGMIRNEIDEYEMDDTNTIEDIYLSSCGAV